MKKQNFENVSENLLDENVIDAKVITKENEGQAANKTIIVRVKASNQLINRVMRQSVIAFKGISKLNNETDTYNEETGYKIAYNRALKKVAKANINVCNQALPDIDKQIEMLKKQKKKLTNKNYVS